MPIVSHCCTRSASCDGVITQIVPGVSHLEVNGTDLPLSISTHRVYRTPLHLCLHGGSSWETGGGGHPQVQAHRQRPDCRDACTCAGASVRLRWPPARSAAASNTLPHHKRLPFLCAFPILLCSAAGAISDARDEYTIALIEGSQRMKEARSACEGSARGVFAHAHTPRRQASCHRAP